jgi:hypothetical protein
MKYRTHRCVWCPLIEPIKGVKLDVLSETPSSWTTWPVSLETYIERSHQRSHQRSQFVVEYYTFIEGGKTRDSDHLSLLREVKQPFYVSLVKN